MTRMPAMSLAAVPGRRARTLELAGEIERRGFSGIYGPSLSDGLALCEALAFATRELTFGTSITPIYTRHVQDFANAASFIHEVSGGRFRFGIGVSHGPALDRLGIEPGKPLGDMRRFVSDLKAVPRAGELPPLVLATLRRRMIRLAEEIGDGMVFANGARSHMADSLGVLSADARDGDFFIGNMIPTCVSDDRAAAAAVNRRTLTSYAMLPNYRNYWKEAGYEEEMAGVEAAIAAGGAGPGSRLPVRPLAGGHDAVRVPRRRCGRASRPGSTRASRRPSSCRRRRTAGSSRRSRSSSPSGTDRTVTEHVVWVVRHAKSGYPIGVGDFSRPLAPRGRRQGPRMAAWLRSREARADIVLTSAARRAVDTAEQVRQAFDLPPDALRRTERALSRGRRRHARCAARASGRHRQRGHRRP